MTTNDKQPISLFPPKDDHLSYIANRFLCFVLFLSLVKNLPIMQEIPFDFWSGKMPWRRDRPPIPVFLGFPGDSVGKESACNVGDLGLIPGLGRSPGGGHGNPLQYSCLESPHGQRSLAGCSPWGHKESDTTE